MQSERENPPGLDDIASWVLKKLARDDYYFVPVGNEGRWELTIWQWEEEFGELLKPEEVKLLASRVLNPEWLSKLGESRDDLTDVVLRNLLSPAILGKHLKDMRLALAPKVQAAAESNLYEKHPNVMRNAIASAILGELGEKLPKLINRVEQMRSLSTEIVVPKDVQVYLEEASQCFIFGRFIPCLIVCRSAIEFALGDLLKRQDTIDNLIRYRREKLPWTLKPTLDLADEVRIAANHAVHPVSGAVPTGDVCREMFDKTRAVLKELYSEQDLSGPLGRNLTG